MWKALDDLVYARGPYSPSSDGDYDPRLTPPPHPISFLMGFLKALQISPITSTRRGGLFSLSDANNFPVVRIALLRYYNV